MKRFVWFDLRVMGMQRKSSECQEPSFRAKLFEASFKFRLHLGSNEKSSKDFKYGVTFELFSFLWKEISENHIENGLRGNTDTCSSARKLLQEPKDFLMGDELIW